MGICLKSAFLWVFAAFVWLALGWAPTAGAQTDANPSDPPVAAPVEQPANASTAAPAGYKIQPGDTLSLTVSGLPDYSGSFPVRSDGSILIQDEMIGAVIVSGYTVPEASRLLTAKIEEYLRDPAVILTISRFKVVVVGAVRQPGQYEVASGTRLLEAIEKAGGAQDENSDLAHVFLTKFAGEEVQFNVRDFKQKGDQSQNPLIEPGDRVSVGKPIASGWAEVKISGAVAKPGTYPLETGETTVLDVVSRAGRWTDDANPRGARLIHKDGVVVPIDVTQLDKEPNSEINLLLRDGDELFIPRNTAVVNVLGGVRKPGQYHVAPGATLLEVITAAGGLEEGAILNQCAVVRAEPKPERISANLERLMKQGDMTQNPALQDRDVVFVPTRSSPRPDKKGVFESLTDSLWRYIWIFRGF